MGDSLFDPRLKRAQELVDRGEYDKAIEEFENLLKLVPEDLNIAFTLLKLYALRGLISKVVETYIHIISIYEQENALEKAIDVCQKIIRLVPYSIEARKKLIDIYSRMNDKDSVREQCFTLSKIYSMEGQAEEAAEMLKKGIEVDPENVSARLELARLNIKQGQIEEGIAQYKEVADAFLEREDYERAAEVLREITVFQEDENIYFKLGDVYHRLGKLEEAKTAYRKVIRTNLQNTYALIKLGEVSMEKGELDGAMLAFRKVIELEADNPLAKERLAEVYEKKEQWEEALKLYFEAALNYKDKGAIEDALELTQIVLDASPTHKKALELMEELKAIAAGTKLIEKKEVSEKPEPIPTGETAQETPSTALLAREVRKVLLKKKTTPLVSESKKTIPLAGKKPLLVTSSAVDKKTKTIALLKRYKPGEKEEEVAVEEPPKFKKRIFKAAPEILKTPAPSEELIAPPSEEAPLPVATPVEEAKPLEVEVPPAVEREKKEKVETLEAAREALSSGNVNLAIQKYEEAIREVPESIEIRLELASVYFKFNLLEKSARLYEEVFLRDKEHLEALEKQLEILHFSVEPDFEEIREKSLTLYQCYKEKGLIADSRDLLLDLVFMYPEDLEIREKLIEEYKAEGRMHEVMSQYLALADIYHEQKDFEKEIEICKKLLELYPEHFAAIERLAEVLLAVGRKEEAQEKLLSLALIYLEKKLWKEAMEVFERTLEFAPENIQIRKKLIDLYTKLGLSSKAIEENMVVADLYIKQGNLEEAYEMLQEVLGTEPRHIEAREKLVELYLQKQDVDKAISEYKALAEILVRKNMLDKVISICEKLISLRPESLEFHIQLADFYKQKGITSKALSEYLLSAELSYKQGDLEKAQELYQTILGLDNNNLEARYNLGIILFEKGKLEEALGEFELILKLSPLYKDTMQKLLDGYIKANNLAKAIQIAKEVGQDKILVNLKEEYLKRVNENPDDDEARYNLALIHKEIGELESAIEHIQEILKHKKKLLESYNLLGLCFDEMGMGNLAINQFQKGLSIEGYPEEDYQELRYNLGLLYERRGMLKDALRMFQEAWGVNIRYKDVAQKVKQLKEQLKGDYIAQKIKRIQGI